MNARKHFDETCPFVIGASYPIYSEMLAFVL